jgi:hypothetical protein
MRFDERDSLIDNYLQQGSWMWSCKGDDNHSGLCSMIHFLIRLKEGDYWDERRLLTQVYIASGFLRTLLAPFCQCRGLRGSQVAQSHSQLKKIHTSNFRVTLSRFSSYMDSLAELSVQSSLATLRKPCHTLLEACSVVDKPLRWLGRSRSPISTIWDPRFARGGQPRWHTEAEQESASGSLRVAFVYWMRTWTRG